jgi:hypothetical protein
MNRTKRVLITLAACLFAIAALPARANAQVDMPARSSEPSAAQVVQAALRYFRIHPEALDGLRSAAHARGIVPTLSTSYHFDDWRFIQVEDLTGFQPHHTDSNWNQQNNSANVELAWDLGNLVFNPDEMQVFGIIMTQQQVMVQVTQTYFARRQLMLRLSRSPPEDPVARDSLQLRIDEFTAQLDILTGGWFTRASRRR